MPVECAKLTEWKWWFAWYPFRCWEGVPVNEWAVVTMEDRGIAWLKWIEYRRGYEMAGGVSVSSWIETRNAQR